MSKNILDNVAEIKKLDSQNMLGSLEQLANQVESIFEESKELVLPAPYKKCRQVVVAGMGGSTLGSHIIKSLFFDKLSVPFEIVNGYTLPSYVGKDTLVIVSSYSGTTEEALSCLTHAITQKARVIIFTSGGELKKQAGEQNIPALIFSTLHNPCGSPRMGLGYSIVGQMLILAQAEILKFGEPEIKTIVQTLKKYQDIFGVTNETSKNIAKQMAEEMLERSVWFMASEHLVGNAHVGANQMNENAKRFAGYFAISELNHHLLEGMMFPKTNPTDVAMLLIASNLYDERVQKRYKITEEVLKKNNILYSSYTPNESDKLSQISEVLLFSSYVSYYSALLEGIDPTAIPFVDYFKEQLKK